jgi:16S rRNA (guanine527-N7)-methyltransferase
MQVRRVFQDQLRQWGLPVSEELADRLDQYVELLSSYDEANVVGTRDPDNLLLDHILDSLSCFLFHPLWQAQTLADVGSGAGLPGIPLKVVSPNLRATLVESVGKKARFLCHAVQHLGLEDVSIKNQRVEEVAVERDLRESYDIATARAVASLPILAEYCVPLVREGGYVIAMKGSPSAEELREGERAAECVGARLADVIEVSMLQEVRAKERRLIILQKVRATPERYPRRVGAAKRRPLG